MFPIIWFAYSWVICYRSFFVFVVFSFYFVVVYVFLCFCCLFSEPHRVWAAVPSDGRHGGALGLASYRHDVVLLHRDLVLKLGDAWGLSVLCGKGWSVNARLRIYSFWEEYIKSYDSFLSVAKISHDSGMLMIMDAMNNLTCVPWISLNLMVHQLHLHKQHSKLSVHAAQTVLAYSHWILLCFNPYLATVIWCETTCSTTAFYRVTIKKIQLWHSWIGLSQSLILEGPKKERKKGTEK